MAFTWKYKSRRMRPYRRFSQYQVSETKRFMDLRRATSGVVASRRVVFWRDSLDDKALHKGASARICYQRVYFMNTERIK